MPFSVIALFLFISVDTVLSAYKRCPLKGVSTQQIGKCDPTLGKQHDAGALLGYTCYMESGKDVKCPDFKGKEKHYEMIQTDGEIASSQLDPKTQAVVEFKYKMCNYHKICIGDNEKNPACSLHDYINTSPAYDNTKCPKDLDNNKYLFTLPRQYMGKTHDIVDAMNAGKAGGDFNFMHFGSQYYPQWILSYYKEHNVLLINFQGSEPYRLPDMDACIDITHKQYKFGDAGDVIHVSKGIASVIDNASELYELLVKDLAYIFQKYNIVGTTKEQMRFVITGTSLGAAYAHWWYLGLYGKVHNLVGEYASEIVGKYLPTESELDRVWVIAIMAPLIVYHKDIDKIPDQLQDRIYNIIVGLDPVPMLAGGKHGLQIKGDGHAYDNGGWLKALRDAGHRQKMASNGAMGNYYVLSYANLNDDGKTNIVQKMDDKAIEEHLSNGGRCLWSNKYLGKSVMDAGKMFGEYHAKQYFTQMDNSGCFNMVKDIKRVTFDIKYCKPKTKTAWGRKRKNIVRFSDCYKYTGNERKADDFINEKECECSAGYGKFKHFTGGLKKIFS